MTTAGHDTGRTRTDEPLARVYQQVISAQAAQYAAAWDAGAGAAWFSAWLQKQPQPARNSTPTRPSSGSTPCTTSRSCGWPCSWPEMLPPVSHDTKAGHDQSGTPDHGT